MVARQRRARQAGQEDSGKRMLQGCRASDKFLLKIYSIGQESERGNTHRDKRSKIKNQLQSLGGQSLLPVVVARIWCDGDFIFLVQVKEHTCERLITAACASIHSRYPTDTELPNDALRGFCTQHEFSPPWIVLSLLNGRQLRENLLCLCCPLETPID